MRSQSMIRHRPITTSAERDRNNQTGDVGVARDTVMERLVLADYGLAPLT